MGGIRQEPVRLVKCETSDIEVPADAEMVIEGFVSSDPATFVEEGPFGEYTGYYNSKVTRRPVVRVECITHRTDPTFVGTLASALPGQPGEGATMMSIHWAAMVWEVIEKSGIPGLLDVRMLPPSCETSVALRIHKTYRGQGKHIAAALIGSSLPLQSCKNILVVDEDVDIYNFEALSWAIDYRVNPMDNRIVVLPDMPGIDSDPAFRPEPRETAAYGGFYTHRVIIDATKNWSFGRREEWGNDFYPPLNVLNADMKSLVTNRWQEYGLG
jgi:4-hydroxy-3-polyprenylbenzoate decarboxylase